ncbi:hypothetical protein OCA90_00830 [Bacillus cereus]|nr:hypothetical protein [Bacillus cereus]MCU5529349.1 hypothetical protein [Bacillus cereus]MDZ4481607.1 hypothetical protein [Bacillus cereus]
MAKKASPLKLGREVYGTLKIDEVFLHAFSLYFLSLNETTKTPG